MSKSFYRYWRNGKTSLGFILPSMLVGVILEVGMLSEISKKDDEGNFTEGNIYQKNNTNCYLRGEKRLIAAIGLKM